MNKWSRINYLPNLPLYEGKERVTESKAHIELSKNAAKEGMVYTRDDDLHRSSFGMPPVVCNYFYHEEVKKSAKKGKQ